MASLATFFEVNKQNFVNGQTRVLYSQLSNGALTDQPVPSNIESIFATESPYTPVSTTSSSPWVDIGGTAEGIDDSRELAINEWRVEQQLTAILLVPGEVVHTVKIPMMEVARADLLYLFENASTTNSIAQAGKVGAQTQVPFGQFTDLNQYRIALAGFMPLEAGTVTESTGGTRPRFFVKVFNRCSLSAETTTLNWKIAQPLHADVTLRAYLEPGQSQNQEIGAYFIEAADTYTT